MCAWIRIVVVALAVAITAACHTYRPIETPGPGSLVRVRVPVTSPLADPNAPPAVISVEGRVVSAADTLTLATRTRRTYTAVGELIQHDTVRLARADLAGVELQQFSGKRSVALGIAIAGGVTVAILTAIGFGGGGSAPPDVGSGGLPLNASVVSSILSSIGR